MTEFQKSILLTINSITFSVRQSGGHETSLDEYIAIVSMDLLIKEAKLFIFVNFVYRLN